MTQSPLPWRLDHAVSRVALEQPKNIALELQGFSISYEVLEQQSNYIAAKLLANGFGAGHFIAVAASNVAEFATGCLAVMKSGAAYVALDLRYSHSRIENVLEQGTASLILSSYWFPEKLAPEGVPVWREFDTWLTRPTPMPNIAYEENAPACLCYTSGTTGAPKGAIITHAGIEGLVNDPVFSPYSKLDRVAQLTTYAFDAATLEVWGALVSGACLVEVPKSLLTIPHRFQAFLKHNRISSMWLTTSYFNAIASRRPDAFQTLKALFIGGEAASVGVLKSVFSCDGAPKRLINGYGPTEATCLTTWHPISKADAISGVIPIGKPLLGRQVSVRDNELMPLSMGEEGELVISGPALANGYINDEVQTNEKFVSDPIDPSQILYRTGDRAKQNIQGNFLYLGRNDDQIKVRGLRVEVSAVINVLISLKGVSSAVVLARTYEPETQEMIAFVQLSDEIEKPLTSEKLRSEMALSVPDYMVPAQLHIVDRFPTTDSGKLDRKALFQSISAPVQSPKLGDNLTAGDYPNCASTVNELDTRIALIWQKALGRVCNDFQQDFYDLGGDSLKLIQIIEEIETEFGYGLNAKDLHSPLTVSGLAERIAQNTIITESSNGAFLIWMRWWLLPVPETILQALGKGSHAQILDIPVSISDLSKTQGFERIIAYLEKRLLDICPEGPYRLAGYSYTGVLAYELAQRLRARGKEVELLVLLDSYCGKPLLHRRVIRVLKKGVGKWVFLRLKSLLTRATVSSALVSSVSKRPEAKYYSSSIANAAEYRAATYGGKTLVVKTTDPQAYILPEWKKRLTGDFRIVTVEGDHESIMKRPAQTQVVCEALEKC